MILIEKMKKTIAIAFILVPLCARGQSIAKIDMIAMLKEIPQPPSSVAMAYDKSTCNPSFCNADALFTSFENDMNSAESQWKVMNVAQQQQVDSAKQLAASLSGIQGKSTSEQLAIAQKNIPGMNTGAVSMAQQMQDPAFKAKFMAMTPEQKLAYMQSSGAIPASSNPAIDSDAGVTKTRQDFQQKMMSDPSFATQMKNMTPAQQDAYMQQQLNKNGTDWNAIAARSRANTAAHPDTTGQAASTMGSSTGNDLMTLDDNPSSAPSSSTVLLVQQSTAAMSALQQFNPSTTAAAAHIDSIIASAPGKLQAALKAHQQQLQASGAPQGEGGYSDPKGDRAIRLQYITNEISDVNAALASLNSAFNSDKSKLNTIVGAYNTSLVKSGYGATLTSPADQANITGLAKTQIQAMSAEQNLESTIKKIYPEVAFLSVQQAEIQNEK